MAAAKDNIAGQAGDHHRQENDNDGLQRHSVLLPSSIPPTLPPLVPGAKRHAQVSRLKRVAENGTAARTPGRRKPCIAAVNSGSVGSRLISIAINTNVG
jgi:hypothetical protein